MNLATLVVMANGLTRSGFIDWFANTMSTHLEGFSPDATVIVLVLVFYFAHYLFASLSAHTATMLPVILAVGKGIRAFRWNNCVFCWCCLSVSWAV